MRMKEKLACIALLSCGKKCGIGWLSLRWTGYAKIRRLNKHIECGDAFWSGRGRRPRLQLFAAICLTTKRLDLFDAVDVRTFP